MTPLQSSPPLPFSSAVFIFPKHSPQTGSGAPLLRPVLHCFSSCIVSFYWDSGGVTLTSWWLGTCCPAPIPVALLLKLLTLHCLPPSLLPHVWTVSRPSPRTTHCGFVACIWSIPTLQSWLSINTVLYCSVCLCRPVMLVCRGLISFLLLPRWISVTESDE